MYSEKRQGKIHWYHSIFMKQMLLFMVLLFPGIFFCIQLYSSFSMEVQKITLELKALAPEEAAIILAGCLINYYAGASD